MAEPGNIAMPLTVTAFTKDEAGRWTYNTIEEAKKGPIDLLVVGGGSFGGIFADHLFRLETADTLVPQPPSPIADQAGNELNARGEPPHAPHRIVVLEAGSHGLPEHIQNLPFGLNLGIPNFKDELISPSTNQPWSGNVGFPGLAYAIGGRSLFWGGWSPELIESELARWPAELVNDLKGRRFPEAKRQLGTDTTNDFMFGPLHFALRERLSRGLNRGDVPAALPIFGDDDLEAPLAVQSSSPRPGFMPARKFSAVPLLVSTARKAANVPDESKRFMIIPNCKVTKLNANNGRVQSADIEYAEIAPQLVNNAAQLVKTVKKDTLELSSRAKVVIAIGTIESTRLAKQSFDRDLMGRNLMAHLRSNLVVRFPRSNFQHLPSELAASALFVKCRGKNGHFHFQITAYGNPTELNPDQEAELFKSIPSLEQLDYFLEVDDRFIIMVIRGIGEMESNRKATGKSKIEIKNGKADVTLALTDPDKDLWEEMDTAAEQVARVFAAGGPIEYMWEYNWGSVWRTSPPPHAPRQTPAAGVRDGLGTTHHEAGTLWIDTDPNDSVTDLWGRFHHVENAYVAGPALFPTIGSPNPMLTGTALARRTAHKIARAPLLTASDGPVQALSAAERRHWRMIGPGSFGDDGEGGIVAQGPGMGLLWYSKWQLRNFRLTVEWKVKAASDNSGVFVRFPSPARNPWIAVDSGYEIQIDDLGAQDDPAQAGKPIYKTGAIYGIQGASKVASKDPASADPWNTFVIEVVGQTYNVWLNGEHVVTDFQGTRTGEGYVGLQNHGNPVSFRNIVIAPLPIWS